MTGGEQPVSTRVDLAVQHSGHGAGRGAPASAAATSPAPVLLGKANTETATTSISNAKGTALSATTTHERDSAVAGTDASTAGGTGVSGASTNGIGVSGTSTHSLAVSGTSTNGTGVYGASTNGIAIGGVSTNSGGVAGTTAGDGQSGVAGDDESTGGGYGVFGSSTNGTGVAGTTSGNSQNGVAGTDTSTLGGYGVYGTSTNGWGVYGTTEGTGSPNDIGVVGICGNNGQIGVQGYDGSETGQVGVWAESLNGTALYAGAPGTAATVTANLRAAFLSKTGGSFKIDHPLDPAGKYLYHSFVESPDMMNIYNGTVTLDRAGRARIQLPDWFEALNRDYRYQLTPIGGPAPNLHIAAEVADGQFAIAGGAAGQEVSWQVTGIRQDAWANANRIPVEEAKSAEDRGRYLHPELHGGEPITSTARAHAERHRSARTTTQRPHNQAIGASAR
jgi:hypothetical protein